MGKGNILNRQSTPISTTQGLCDLGFMLTMSLFYRRQDNRGWDFLSKLNEPGVIFVYKATHARAINVKPGRIRRVNTLFSTLADTGIVKIDSSDRMVRSLWTDAVIKHCTFLCMT